MIVDHNERRCNLAVWVTQKIVQVNIRDEKIVIEKNQEIDLIQIDELDSAVRCVKAKVFQRRSKNFRTKNVVVRIPNRLMMQDSEEGEP